MSDKILQKVSQDAKLTKIYALVMLVIYAVILVTVMGLKYFFTGTTESNFTMTDADQINQTIKSSIFVGVFVTATLSVVVNGLLFFNASKMQKNPDVDKSTVLIVLSILSCIFGVVFPVLGIIPIVLSFNIRSLHSLTK